MKVTFDIETIPAQSPEFYQEILTEEMHGAKMEAEDVAPPSNYKSEETIAKWWQETGLAKRQSILNSAEAAADERYRKTSLDGAFGQIAVIGYAIDDADPVALWMPEYAHPEAEAAVISQFYGALLMHHSHRDPMQFVGHNVTGFDLRFLLQRSIINNVRPPESVPFNSKPWEQDKVFDTMTAWAGVGGKISLAKLCKALRIKGKTDGIDGSKVWDFVKSGRLEEVAEYCKDDVLATRECYKRLTFSSAANGLKVAA